MSEAAVERREKFSRWVVRGRAQNERFGLASLEGGDLNVFLERCQFNSVDFSGIEFRHFYAAGSTFVGCDFSNARFSQLGLGQPQVQGDWNRPIKPGDPRYPQTVYEDCVFRQTKFDPNNTHFGNSRFVRCLFDHAWLRKLFSRSAEFIDCRFRGKVIECTFFGTNSDEDTKRIGRTTNEFRGNDFREADLIWVAFRRIDLGAQLLPESDEYAVVIDPYSRIQAAADKAKATLAGEKLEATLKELGVLAQLYGDERQVLIRRGQLGWQSPPEMGELLWSYLTAN